MRVEPRERYASADELSRINSDIVKLESAVRGDNRRQVMLAMDDLEADTKDFAARRMDKSIRRARVWKGRTRRPVAEMVRTTITTD